MLVGEVIKISIKFILKCTLFSMFSHLFFCRFQEGSIRLNVLSYSKVNIICPTKYVALKETDSDPTENQLYENVWMVDSLSYHSCNINTSIASNKKLLNCDQPSKLHWTKLLFLPLTPFGDAGYNPGETYYYICEYLNWHNYMYGLFTWKEEDPRRQNNFSLGLHAEILVCVMP